MERKPLELWRVNRAVLSLVLSSIVCLVLALIRARHLGIHGFGFLPANLVLAWIPVLFAYVIYALHVRGAHRRSLVVACAVIWFLFYPNAPYLVTDLIHIKWNMEAFFWFDLLVMMTAAWTGLLLGNISLYLMQEVIRDWRGRTAGWLFAIGMLALGSIGVFVGRFWRWNSRDVLLHPIGLAAKTNQHFHATTAGESIGFIATFFAFSTLTYATLYTFVHLRTDSPGSPASTQSVPEPKEKPVAVEAPLG